MGLNNPPDNALLTGRPGGQEVIGGPGASDDLELRSGRSILLGDVAGGNYTEFENDGTLELIGDATVWEDFRVPVTATVGGGSSQPDSGKLIDDGSGSQGVFIKWFDPVSEEELYFTAQIPHDWKTGTDFLPHVHWVPKTNGGADKKACWGLEYTWIDRGEIAGNTTIVYSNSTRQGDSVLLANRHYVTEFASISGTDHTISSMLVCRVFRDATGAGGVDDYSSDAGLLEIDFHYEIDMIGSRETWEK